MKWFRLYHDLPNDRKLRKFSPQQKWAWVVLLCIASESKDRGYIRETDDSDTADYCGFESTQDYLFFVDKLRQKGMVEPVAGGIKITHWEDRQYIKPSDLPEATRARKRKQRKKLKNSTEEGVPSNIENDDHENVTRDIAGQRVMSRHTDTDTDTEVDPDLLLEIVDPINTALVLGEPTGECRGDRSEEKSASPKNPKVSKGRKNKRGWNSEEILKDLNPEMRDRFDSFWKGYCKFCKDRGASSGAKNQAAREWIELVGSGFHGKGLQEFNRGVKLFVRLQGDRTSGIPHGCRFLYAPSKGSGLWEDALEQEASGDSLGEFSGGQSNLPPVFEAPDQPESFTPAPDFIKQLNRQLRSAS